MVKQIMPDEKTDNVSQTLPRLAYTMQETADILGVSYITVHRLLKRGLLKSSTARATNLFPLLKSKDF
jgi:hypothetical protein